MKNKVEEITKLKLVLVENLNFYLNRKGINQTDMARELGIPETTVSNWMKGETYPRPDKLQMMADYFNIRRSDLTEKRIIDNAHLPSTEYNYFPDVAISAGLPNFVEGVESAESISIPDVIMGKCAGDQNVFFAHVNGESMNKVIPHGSLIAIRPTAIDGFKNGDIVVYSDSYEYSVKRFYKVDERLLFKPESHNPEFTDNVYSIYNENLKIHGKVISYTVFTN